MYIFILSSSSSGSDFFKICSIEFIFILCTCIPDRQCIVEPTDFRGGQFLHDLSDSPTDSDLLERQQQAVIKQQEHDLRQMKNGRPVKPGNSL